MKLYHHFTGLICLLNCFMLIGQDPVILEYSVNSSSVPLYGKFELTVGIDATYNNPYDYDQLTLQAIISRPSGIKDTVDGFFMQEFNLDEETGSIQFTGENSFRIRYAPMELGEHEFTLLLKDINGEVKKEDPETFLAEMSTEGEGNKGFVKTNNSNYLSFDNGDQYIPIGENIAWQNGNIYRDYTKWLSGLSESGGNFFRLWHAHWGLGIEWRSGYGNHQGLKKYNQTTSAYQDWLYDYCADKDIYIMLALQHHGPVSTNVNSNWNDNPYNAANGGPCVTPTDFFTNEEARALTKNRLRYIMARWGYSTSIMCWELFNEVHWTDNFIIPSVGNSVIAWHLEMAAFIESLDVYGHLISTSMDVEAYEDDLWGNDLMDFSQTHIYNNVSNIEKGLAGKSRALIDHFQKPAHVGEFGLGGSSSLAEVDPDGIHIHNAMWATLFSGAMGTAMTWWWDTYIHPNDLYYHNLAIRRVTDIVPFKDQNLTPFQATSSGADADLNLSPTLNWGQIADMEIFVNRDGTTTPSIPKLSYFLYGAQWNTAYRSPPNFHVYYEKEGEFSIKTGPEGATSPKIIITVDEAVKLETIAEPNKIYTVTIPEGDHTIKVDNNGTDWISIGGYSFEDLGSAIDAYILLAQDKANGAGYILNSNYNHVNALNNALPAAISEAKLMIPDIPKAMYEITWYETLEGNSFRSELVNHDREDLVLTIPVPDLNWDMAFTISYAGVVNTNDYSGGNSIEIFPNPVAKGEQIIVTGDHLDGEVLISFFNAAGAKLKNFKVQTQEKGQIKINNELPVGLYWVHLYFQGKVAIKLIAVH